MLTPIPPLYGPSRTVRDLSAPLICEKSYVLANTSQCAVRAAFLSSASFLFRAVISWGEAGLSPPISLKNPSITLHKGLHRR